MRILFFTTFVSILFIVSCQKIEENPSYKIELKSNQVMKVHKTEMWRDTIFYSIIGAKEENYRFVLHYSYHDNYSGYNDVDKYVRIVDQTPNYLIYEVQPNFYSNIILYLTTNGDIIDQVELPSKYIVNPYDVKTGFLLYSTDANEVKRYDFEMQKHSLVSSFNNSISFLKLHPSGKYYATRTASSIYYQSIQGITINQVSTSYVYDLGFNQKGQLFYITSNRVNFYSDIENSTTTYSMSVPDVNYFESAPNDYYYNISENYYIKEGNSIEMYYSYRYPKDLAINKEGTVLLFVDDSDQLMTIDVNTKVIKTIYTNEDYYSYSKIEDPDFNEDGTRIAFSMNGDIYMINTDGTNLENITNTPNIIESNPNW